MSGREGAGSLAQNAAVAGVSAPAQRWSGCHVGLRLDHLRAPATVGEPEQTLCRRQLRNCLAANSRGTAVVATQSRARLEVGVWYAVAAPGRQRACSRHLLHMMIGSGGGRMAADVVAWGMPLPPPPPQQQHRGGGTTTPPPTSSSSPTTTADHPTTTIAGRRGRKRRGSE